MKVQEFISANNDLDLSVNGTNYALLRVEIRAGISIREYRFAWEDRNGFTMMRRVSI